MKIVSIIVAALLSLSISARAEVDNVTASAQTITTAGFTNTYFVRGLVEGVNITIPTAKTATVTVVTASGLTLYSGSALTSDTDGYTPIRFPVRGSTGAALTWITAQAAEANAATNILYDRVGVAEAVTITVTPAANTTGTNTYTAELIVSK